MRYLLMASILWAANVDAGCYELWNKSGELTYQSSIPPYDLSYPNTSAEWQASQAKGEVLVLVENNCPRTSDAFPKAFSGLKKGSVVLSHPTTNASSDMYYANPTRAKAVAALPIYAKPVAGTGASYRESGYPVDFSRGYARSRTYAGSGDYTMAPDGTYVGGRDYTMAPDGTYVGGHDYTMAPDGTYVGGRDYTMAPDGTYVGGRDYTMTPDGRYVGGRDYTMTPDGSYVGTD